GRRSAPNGSPPSELTLRPLRGSSRRRMPAPPSGRAGKVRRAMAAPPAQRDLWLFLGLTFVLGWSLLAILPLVGAEPGSRTVSVVLALNAFCPGIAAWVVERMAFRRSALAARTGLLVRVPGISWGRWWA